MMIKVVVVGELCPVTRQIMATTLDKIIIENYRLDNFVNLFLKFFKINTKKNKIIIIIINQCACVRLR